MGWPGLPDAEKELEIAISDPEDEVPGARYSHFAAILDCDDCGSEIQVEGDVSNGEKVYCDVCGQDREVYSR